jgi:thiol-disulfide isomerase/thioredoxin
LLALAASSDDEFRFVDRDGQDGIIVRPEPDKPLLLHFWASWCAECTEDLANLDAAAARCAGVRTVAVNAAESQDRVDAYLTEHPLRIEALRDPRGEVWRRLDGRGLPMNAYWSAAGQKTDVGPKSRKQWDAVLETLGCSK